MWKDLDAMLDGESCDCPYCRRQLFFVTLLGSRPSRNDFCLFSFASGIHRGYLEGVLVLCGFGFRLSLHLS